MAKNAEIVINDETKPSLADVNLSSLATTIVEQFISKVLQGPWIHGIVVKVLQMLEQYVPTEVMHYVGMITDGISDAEFTKLETELVTLIDAKINIKALPDFLEPMVFKAIVGALFSLAKQGQSFPMKTV